MQVAVIVVLMAQIVDLGKVLEMDLCPDARETSNCTKHSWRSNSLTRYLVPGYPGTPCVPGTARVQKNMNMKKGAGRGLLRTKSILYLTVR